MQEMDRDARAGRWVDDLRRDVLFAFRRIRRQPAASTLAVVTLLAIGIGANTATFSLVHGLLLRPLPYPDSEAIVSVGRARRGGTGTLGPRLSNSELLLLRDGTRSFERLAAYGRFPGVLSGPDGRANLFGATATPSLFPLLRTTPRLGRLFTEADAVDGANRVVLLSHRTWTDRFGSDPDVIGRPIGLNDDPHLVVGVLPDGFEFPDPVVELWTPLVVRPFEGASAGSLVINAAFNGIGRLRPGVSVEQATTEIRAILARASSDRPMPPGIELETRVARLREERGRLFRPALLVLNAATGLVLLMACANVAGLLLGRGVVRQRELALRGALGARRSRIVRQLMTESVILSLAGGATGLALAAGIVQAAPALVPRAAAFGLAAPGLPDVGLDGTVLAFVAGLSVATGLFFGTVPALASSQVDPARILNDGSPLPAGGFGRGGGNRMQAALAVGQMALAVVFLTAAGLLLRSFVSLVAFDLGFDPTNVVTARAFSPARSGMFLEGGRFDRDEIEAMNARARGFAETLERQTERIANLPGVEAVALSSSLPLGPASRAREVRVVGRPEPSEPRERLQAGLRRVGPGYADVVRLPLLAGRFFTAADAANAPRVAVVSESFARAAFGGEPPLGRRLRLPDLPFPGPAGNDGAEDAETWEIIGVAGDVRFPSRGEPLRPDSAGDLYLSMLQPAPERKFSLPEGAPAVNVRTTGDPAAVVPFLRELLSEVAPGALIDVSALTTVLSVRSAQPRFFAACAGMFGAVALLLAAFGLYGVLSYRVAQRRAEIGVRMALGAGRGDVVMLVVRQGGALVVSGLIVGLLGAAAAARVIESVLFGVPPADPLTFGAVTTVLLAVGLLACWLPACRATRIDPLDTLRDA